MHRFCEEQYSFGVTWLMRQNLDDAAVMIQELKEFKAMKDVRHHCLEELPKGKILDDEIILNLIIFAIRSRNFTVIVIVGRDVPR